MCSLESFGVPYLAPVAPLRLKDMGDNFYRRSWRGMITRPRLTAKGDIRRQNRRGAEKNDQPE
ncbi:spore germination protein [Candidatus Contubernalis alkalaceticus]|nr:spore germination protein [Candidatus Contubernalis alkalaceticus]